MTVDNNLKFDCTVEDQGSNILFTLTIVDEATIRHFETTYKNKYFMTCDGRTFTMKLMIPWSFDKEEGVALWELMKKDPELVRKHVLKRLKGEV